MAKDGLLKRAFSEIEWRWSLLQLLWGLPAAIASFAVPAWAVSATSTLAVYSPASWIGAGFLGLLISSAAYNLTTAAFAKRIRTKYDARLLAQGGAIDPLERTFERKRIYLNEFCLPSHPLIEGKTFIDCEIIGPANILFVAGNRIDDGRFPVVDAVYLLDKVFPYSAYIFKDCLFRGCAFTRVTYFVAYGENEMFRDYSLVRWVTPGPYDDQGINREPAEERPSSGEILQRVAPSQA